MDEPHCHYPLDPPTKATAVRDFGRVLGDQRAQELMAQAVRERALDADGDLSVEQLRDVAASIAVQEGVVSVLGLSLQIRCDTYLQLARTP